MFYGEKYMMYARLERQLSRRKVGDFVKKIYAIGGRNVAVSNDREVLTFKFNEPDARMIDELLEQVLSSFNIQLIHRAWYELAIGVPRRIYFHLAPAPTISELRRLLDQVSEVQGVQGPQWLPSPDQMTCEVFGGECLHGCMLIQVNLGYVHDEEVCQDARKALVEIFRQHPLDPTLLPLIDPALRRHTR